MTIGKSYIVYLIYLHVLRYEELKLGGKEARNVLEIILHHISNCCLQAMRFAEKMVHSPCIALLPLS